jgi:hypothetical protein
VGLVPTTKTCLVTVPVHPVENTALAVKVYVPAMAIANAARGPLTVGKVCAGLLVNCQVNDETPSEVFCSISESELSAFTQADVIFCVKVTKGWLLTHI